MSLIKLVSTKRLDGNNVAVTYSSTEYGGVTFTVRWCNVDPMTGCDLPFYYLKSSVGCGHPEYKSVVEEAIEFGEDGDSMYGDLYLEVRDTFNSNDCVDI